MWTRKSGFLFQDFLVVSYEWKILNLLFSKSFLLFEKFPVLKWYRLSIINSFFCVLVSVHIDFSCIFFPGTGNYWNARGHLRNSVNRNIENNFAPPIYPFQYKCSHHQWQCPIIITHNHICINWRMFGFSFFGFSCLSSEVCVSLIRICRLSSVCVCVCVWGWVCLGRNSLCENPFIFFSL